MDSLRETTRATGLRLAPWAALLFLHAGACGGGDSGQDVLLDADTLPDGEDVPPDVRPDGDVPSETDVRLDADVTPDGDVPDEGETAPECGNGVTEGTEECDDGNDTAGDGCENDCAFTCTETDDTCPAYQHCVDATHTCAPGCRADEGCTGSPTGDYCDVDAHACVACLGDEQCDAGFVCIDHACAEGCNPTHPCSMGLECCGGGCIDTQTSEEHCGACDVPCTVTAGTPDCVAGDCTVGACDPGFDDCDGDPASGCEIETAVDLANCGTCDTVCPDRANATTTCALGVCGHECLDGFLDCNGLADDGCETVPADDAANCGSCDNACATPDHGSAACTAGVCGIGSCDPGWTDCNATYSDGCEIETAADTANCGSCGNICPTPDHGAAGCASGSCGVGSCGTGWADCNLAAADGCEVDTTSTVGSCGACGTVCTVANGTPACAASTCAIGSCTPAWQDCNVSYADGCEINTSNSATNCGSCGFVCRLANATAGCAGSLCNITMCNPGWADCDVSPANGCEINLNTSLGNCGGCGRLCALAHAVPVCTGGACRIASCTAPWLDCNATTADGCEVNVSTDPRNCGSCGSACTLANAVAGCAAGACTVASCAAGFGNCDVVAANGCETNLNTSSSNCGGCGNVCPAGGVCVGGSCVLPPANDTRAGATLIDLAATSVSLAADTTYASNNTTGPAGCNCTSGNDVFYRFTLAGTEIVYADTSGTTWDTSLFLKDSAGTNLTATGLPAYGAVCNDDLGLSGCDAGFPRQSQILARLTAGTYYLVLSGCGAGASTIHFQHLPVGNGAVAFLAAGAGLVVAGTTSGTGSLSGACCSTGPENTYYWYTCPAFAGGAFSASTCSRATWDTELEQRSATRAPVAVCNDDACASSQSQLSSTLPSGAGLHTLYVDGCLAASGSYQILYTRP